MDLTQAEAVLGVIDAADRRQLETALGQLAGGLSRPLMALRERLLHLLAELEAGLDFAEEDIERVSTVELRRRLAEAAEDLALLSRQVSARSRAGDAARVVLVGQPNVGKSSLFNALAGEAAAIVSARSGTTRDYLVRRVDMGGVAIELVDTAGADTTADNGRLSAAVQAVAAQARRHADIELFCLDASRPLSAWERTELGRQPEGRRIVAWTKADLADAAWAKAWPGVVTSSVRGDGLDDLRAAVAEAALAGQNTESSVVAATAARCGESLCAAAAALAEAKRCAADGGGEELVAAAIRAALDELGKVAGAVYTEDLLERIFCRFCIGK